MSFRSSSKSKRRTSSKSKPRQRITGYEENSWASMRDDLVFTGAWVGGILLTAFGHGKIKQKLKK